MTALLPPRTAPAPSASGRPEREVVVAAHGLVVDYGAARAVDGIDLAVRRGEVLGLLGTNGAGKTTTLDVLEGFRPPTAGSVDVLGVDPFRQRDRIAPRVGIMLQDAGFFEDLTARQTVAAWRRFHRDARGVDESLDLVGLGHRARVRVKQLSGGERRRLDLALALLGHPTLLFLDEPTTGMDPEGRQRCLDIVRGLVRDGMTVVLTTHYLEEAELLADRVAIMHRGRIEAAGTLQEVLAHAGRTRVRFSVDAESDTARLLAGLHAEAVPAAGGLLAVEVRTGALQQDLQRLLAAAQRGRLELRDLTVDRPSLEDVFLTLADRR